MQKLMTKENQSTDKGLQDHRLRICIVGAGTHFLSGISYYTLRLANAFASSQRVSVILMRRLIPARLYPGRSRIGQNLTAMHYAPDTCVFDGVDWFWLPSMLKAILVLSRERPKVIIFQWWTGTVLHSYLLLALIGRLLRAKIIVEFHEVIATEETRMRWAGAYVRSLAPLLMRLAHGFVIHSEFDRPTLEQHYAIGKRPVAVIPHGPYDHYQPDTSGTQQRVAPPQSCNILFFGIIRPFKGLEDLITAFNAIPADEIDQYWLTIVGETWEGWTLPSQLIEQSPYRERITFVNRYVRDDEVASFFANADVVALPYHRSSASGPVHVTMSHGLPLVVTEVGGLPEATAGYQGAITIPPADPIALGAALQRASRLRGQRFADPQSWERTVGRFLELFAALPNTRIAVPNRHQGKTRLPRESTDAE